MNKTLKERTKNTRCIMLLSDVCNIISGGTPTTSISAYWNGNIPWISIKDFVSVNRYVGLTEKTITNEGLAHSPTNMLQSFDIIISARGTVGEIAIIPYPMSFNQSCYGLRAKTSLVQPLFLFYWIKANKLKLLSTSHGAVFDTITKDAFSHIDIELPSIADQQHIVDTMC